MCIVALVMLALVPTQSIAAAQQSTSSNSYESTLGYTVTWNDDWSYDEGLFFEVEGAFDIITLWNDTSGFLMFSASIGPHTDPAELLEPDEEDEVISSEMDQEVPQLITEDGTFRTLEEAYLLDDGNLGITAAITTMPADFDDVLLAAQEGVQVNGSPVLTGEPLGDSGSSTAGVEET